MSSTVISSEWEEDEPTDELFGVSREEEVPIESMSSLTKPTALPPPRSSSGSWTEELLEDEEEVVFEEEEVSLSNHDADAEDNGSLSMDELTYETYEEEEVDEEQAPTAPNSILLQSPGGRMHPKSQPLGAVVEGDAEDTTAAPTERTEADDEVRETSSASSSHPPRPGPFLHTQQEESDDSGDDDGPRPWLEGLKEEEDKDSQKSRSDKNEDKESSDDEHDDAGFESAFPSSDFGQRDGGFPRDDVIEMEDASSSSSSNSKPLEESAVASGSRQLKDADDDDDDSDDNDDDESDNGDDDSAAKMDPFASPPPPPNRTLRLFLILLCGLIVVAGVILGLVLSNRDDDDGDGGDVTLPPSSSEDNITTPVPTPMSATPPPTLAPTPPPTLDLDRIQDINGPSLSAYGFSVRMAENQMVVGAPNGDGRGIVYTYEKMENRQRRGRGRRHQYLRAMQSVDTWELVQTQNGPQVGAEFGTAVALAATAASSSTSNGLLVGVPGVFASSTTIPAGAAYYYRWVTASSRWLQVGSPMTGGATAANGNERLGASVATAASDILRVVVGAPGHNPNGLAQAGRVYTWENRPDGATVDWFDMSATPIIGTVANGQLGDAVDISRDGTVLIAGAPGMDAFYIYEWNADTKQWDQALEVNDVDNPGSGLGSDVVLLDSSLAAAGAPDANGERGEVRLYRRSNGSWNQFGPSLSGSAVGDRLGGTLDGAVAATGPYLVVGALASSEIQRYDLFENEWFQRISESTENAALSDISISPDVKKVALVTGSADRDTVSFFDLSTSPPTPTPPTPTPPTPTRSPVLQPTKAPAPAQEWIMSGGPFNTTIDISFGASVALIDGYFAVGAPAAFGGTGAVQTYRFTSTSGWAQLRGVAEQGASGFGTSIDLKVGGGRARLVVGAPNSEDPMGTFGQPFGSVYYFELNGDDWVADGGSLHPDIVPAQVGGRFGGAVTTAAVVKRLAIGAPDSNVAGEEGPILRTGRVFTYSHNGTSWVRMAEPIVTGVAESLLGTSVALSGDGSKLVIGAPGAGDGVGWMGYYEWDGFKWNLGFSQSGNTDGERLGTTVAVVADDANMFAVGAPGYGNNQGAVRVFARPMTSEPFTQLGPDIVGAANEAIGSTLTGADGRVIIGSFTGGFRSYVFLFDQNQWAEAESGPSTDAPVGAISGNAKTVAVGLESQVVSVYRLG